MPRVLAFDVNETLLDLSPLDPLFEQALGSAALRQTWFSQMLQVAFVGGLTDRYVDFSSAGRAALSMVAAAQGAELDEDPVERITGQMRRLPPHPDAEPALTRLGDAGFTLAALTNSTLEVALAQLDHAGLADRFDAILSADQVRALKPRPEPYRLVADTYGVEPSGVRLIAAHAWDVAGALAAGCAAAFVRRPGKADRRGRRRTRVRAPPRAPSGRLEGTLTEGERWTREQLHALLARRFTPAAAGRFLLDSWRRSASVRHERPALARRARRWTGVGALAWVALAVAGVEPFRRRLRDGLGWWAATALMLDWHLGMIETADGRPRDLGAADALTLARAWLVPVALDCPTPLVCALAAATDTLDGPLARRAGPTRAGRDLEGLVDACFAAAALRGAVRRGWLPPLVGGAELLRLSTGLGYAVAVYFGRARRPQAHVLRAARAATAVRTAGLALAGTSRRRTAATLLAVGWGVSVALVAASFRSSVVAGSPALPYEQQHAQDGERDEDGHRDHRLYSRTRAARC